MGGNYSKPGMTIKGVKNDLTTTEEGYVLDARFGNYISALPILSKDNYPNGENWILGYYILGWSYVIPVNTSYTLTVTKAEVYLNDGWNTISVTPEYSKIFGNQLIIFRKLPDELKNKLNFSYAYLTRFTCTLD